MLGEGIRLALGGALRTVAYVEREAYAAATLVARMEDAALDHAPIWDDVGTCTQPEFIEYVRQFRPLLISGGYPCQPFSVAGKRLGAADERHLWPTIDRFVGAARPELVFFENVPGHLSLGFSEVLRNLEGRGYRVAAGLFSAEEVGAGHRRIRLFILGELGHAQSGCGEIRSESDGQVWPTAVDESGGQVGDSPKPAIGGQPGCGMDARTETAQGRQADHDEPNGSSWPLADAGNAHGRSQFKQGEQEEHGGGESERGREIPLFAPGPADGGWKEILSLDPSLEPALCRVADGLAAGTHADRLRLTGNGVVPLAAAYAFAVLAACLCAE